MTKDTFPISTCSIAILLLSASFHFPAQAQTEPKQFRVWAVSCAHVPADIKRKRESLAKVIRQSEGNEAGSPAFDWEIMLDAGDLSAHQYPPGDRDGMELLRQYRALTKHRREQIYNVPGNHDAPYYDHLPGSWFRKWGDPLGEHTEFSGVDPKRRPYPVEGNWERYRFVAGNILFLMLADRNDAPEPVGRGHSRDGKRGGYPPGAVTRDTFNWWKQQVLDNQDKIIVTMHHHVLRDTTTASGKGEGTPTYHGSTGGAEGSSYLYYIIENDDPANFQYTADAHVFEDFLDDYHQQHGRGAIDFWIGGHTHVKGPDDDHGGKTISERKWGVTFLQAAALTVHHGGSFPQSRLITFTDQSDQARIQTYLHEDTYKDQPIGFYQPAERTFPTRHTFKAPAPIQALPPFPKEARVFEGTYVSNPTKSDASFLAQPSPDLTSDWDPQSGGRLQLETKIQQDQNNRIANKPKLVNDTPSGEGLAMSFEGKQRVWVGDIHMHQWTDLKVSAWIKTKSNSPGMRIVSKDRIGEPGCFMLWHPSPGVWEMRAWDQAARKWQAATWRTNTLSDGKWHQLTGIVDSKASKVRLYVDDKLQAETSWTATTLDDSDHAAVVVGADSAEKKFGHTFKGLIHNVQIETNAP